MLFYSWNQTLVIFITIIGLYLAFPVFSLPQFGDINLVVVTDTHSWIDGHKHPDHTPTSDTTYGSLVSFVYHLRVAASILGYDVFFFDNGDCVDGTGLSNATPNDGEKLFPILKNIPFDALNIGNHELYLNSTIMALKSTNFVEHWNGKYLTSNTLYSNNHRHIGSQYTIIRGKTNPSLSLLVFGFLYNMKDHCEAVIVNTVEETLQEHWFVKALKEEEYSAIIVLAHMHYIDPLVTLILTEIRKHVGPNIVVQFITGHSHIRAYQQLDSHSSSFEAGKYFDTIGFISFNLSSSSLSSSPLSSSPLSSSSSSLSQEEISFSPLYLNSHDEDLMQFLQIPTNLFLTSRGRTINQLIDSVRISLGLDTTVGCSQLFYEVARDVTDTHSLWNLYLTHVIPTELFAPHRRLSSLSTVHNNSSVSLRSVPLPASASASDSNHPILLQSTGSFRYDFYAGNWTIDDVYTVSPFNDIYYVLKNIPGSTLQQLYNKLNKYKFHTTDTRLRSPVHASLPNYVSTSTTIDIHGQIYDLYCVGFDHERFVSMLYKLSGIYYMSTILPDITDTSIWFNWIKKNLPKTC